MIGALMGTAFVAIGSAAGGMARYWLSGLVARRFGETFPWGTLIVNVSGSFLIGILAALIAPAGLWPDDAGIRTLLIIGFCGGYTTFSSFALQTLMLVRGGETRPALGYILASAALCFAATWAGLVLAARMIGG